MNQLQARLYILRALRVHADFAFTYDPTLSHQVRKLLRDFCYESDRERLRAASGELEALYVEHGPSTLRCLLEHVHLVHAAHGLRSFLNPTMKLLAQDVSQQDSLRSPLLNELNTFAASPYRVTRQITEILLSIASSVPGLLAELVRHREAVFHLRLQAAERISKERRVEDYPALVDLVDELCGKRDQGSEAFQRRLLPAAQLLGRTGFEGLDLAAEAYDKGRFAPHGPLVLSRFGSTFHRWFEERNPRPSRPWARVLLQAWAGQRLLENRNHLLQILVDDWGRVPGVADLVRRELGNKLQSNPRYLSRCSSEIADKVADFVGGRGDRAARLEPDDETLEAILASRPAWDAFIAQQPDTKGTGWALVRGLVRHRSALAGELILELVSAQENPRVLTGFYDHVLLPRHLRALGEGLQLDLLEHPAAKRYVTTERLATILNARPPFSAEIKAAAERLRVKLFQQFGGPGPDDSTGGLE
jgi:hypothetical protein